MAESTSSMESVASDDFDDVKLSFEGVTMLLNDEWSQSQELFNKYKDRSALMHAGSSMVLLLQGLMTFEEEKLAEAMKALQETEKRCRSKDGFSKNGSKKKKKSESKLTVEEKLQRQIVIADAIIYQAVLTFINQDITSLVKGGWLMRKAWKIYDKVYRDCKMLYEGCPALQGVRTAAAPADASVAFRADDDDDKPASGEGSSAAGGAENGSAHLKNSDSAINLDVSASQDETQTLAPDVIARLLGAVSFGYGVFQLCLSLIPPKILKIIEFLGFEGDRSTGLECLDFASYSKDMKAPLAALGLIWYHTVIRPFFALDGGNLIAGVDEAMNIIERCEKEYPKSSLFLFFKGRAQRLKCDLDAALSTYNSALAGCADQREMKLICSHEIGWIHMMQQNYKDALECFTVLKAESRWSKSYYGYLTGLCHGALGNEAQAREVFLEVPKLVRKKNNQIEAFALKRVGRFQKQPIPQEYCRLLLLEILYLWNAMPQCPKHTIDSMLEVCDLQKDMKVFHLKSLIEGSLYREKGDEEMALQCFKEAIARQSGMKDDFYVPAYASYEIGVMLSQSSTGYEEGRQYLNKAKDNYKDYDFDNRLSVRIQAALRRLKDEGTPI